MPKRDTDRSQLCPCGSGKDARACCQRRPRDGASAVIDAILADLQGAIAGGRFSSIEEAREYLNRTLKRYNEGPRDDFHGLSPHQLSRFLNHPFDSPDIVEFSSRLEAPVDAPVLTLFRALADAIGTDGLRATAQGNLPRVFCREAARVFNEAGHANPFFRLDRINQEADFPELRVTRHAAMAAGLIRKYRQRFMFVDAGRRLWTETGLAGVYPRLLRAHIQRLQWSWADRYPELLIIQSSFLFSLYLLAKWGSSWRPAAFYENCFLKAFPATLDEMPAVEYGTPADIVRKCYTLRFLVRFAWFVGLVELEAMSPRYTVIPEFKVRKTSLLDQSVRFRLPV